MDLIIINWSPLCKALSVQRPQPHTTNLWKEEKDKRVLDKKERADHASRKEFSLLSNPASPTPVLSGLHERIGLSLKDLIKQIGSSYISLS